MHFYVMIWLISENKIDNNTATPTNKDDTQAWL